MGMTSRRPYLIRAVNDWIVDNGMTPYILVNAGFPGTDVPGQFVKDGKIVLNISAAAVHGLSLGMQEISFSARFSGKPCNVRVPVGAVLAVYARENGEGMVLPVEAGAMAADPQNHQLPKKPGLKVVK